MDGALLQLIMLRLRGGSRHRLGQLASAKGVAFLAIVAGVVWLLVRARGGDAAGLFGDGGALAPDVLRAQLHVFLPLGLFAACLFTVFVATGPALYFSQNEINHLFAGPFRRRDLVVYKFATYAIGAVASAAIITLLVPPRASTAPAAFVGTLLTLLFVQLSTAAIKMAVQAFGGDALGRLRKPAVLAAAGVAVVVVFYVLAVTRVNVVSALSDFRYSTPGSVLLAPFAVFANVLLSETVWPGLIGWAAVALAINATLLMTVIGLDRLVADRSLAEYSRLSNRWVRIKRGGSFWASDRTTWQSRRRAPRLGGIGPVAWRQAINAYRNSGRVVLVFLAIGVLTGPVVTAAGISSTSSGVLGGLYFLIAFVMPRSLVCDFRGELGLVAFYKTLPVAPWRVCAGQLVVPVALASLIQTVMIVSIVPFVELTSVVILLTAILFVVPFNLVLYGLENLVFLVFPTKLVPVGRVDFDFLGRTLVDFVAKTFVIFLVIAMARAMGIAAQIASGGGQVTLVSVAWLVVMAAGLAMVPMLAIAFRRFKVSENIE